MGQFVGATFLPLYIYCWIQRKLDSSNYFLYKKALIRFLYSGKKVLSEQNVHQYALLLCAHNRNPKPIGFIFFIREVLAKKGNEESIYYCGNH